MLVESDAKNDYTHVDIIEQDSDNLILNVPSHFCTIQSLMTRVSSFLTIRLSHTVLLVPLITVISVPSDLTIPIQILKRLFTF